MRNLILLIFIFVAILILSIYVIYSILLLDIVVNMYLDNLFYIDQYLLSSFFAYKKPHTLRNILKISHRVWGFCVTDAQVNRLLYVACCVDLYTRAHC